jgi:AraC family ethanolamine operon transcriptional activator
MAMATFVYREADDVDQQAESLAGYRQVYEQLGRGRFHGRLWQLMASSAVIFRESTNRHLRQQVHPPADHLALAVPVAVDGAAQFAGKSLCPDSLMVLTGREGHELTSSGALDLVGISIHQDLLANLAQDKQDWLGRAVRARHLRLAPDSAAAVRMTLLAVLQAAAREEHPVGQQGGDTKTLLATLGQAVLLAMAGEDQTSSIPRRAESRLRVVHRATDYLRAHLHEDIGTADSCRAACASRRSLQYCFEEFLQTTPQAYLRALRLNAARRQLKSSRDTPITFIATELGFNSASHFTRQYRTMFDELPSQTLRSMHLGSAGLA